MSSRSGPGHEGRPNLHVIQRNSLRNPHASRVIFIQFFGLGRCLGHLQSRNPFPPQVPQFFYPVDDLQLARHWR